MDLLTDEQSIKLGKARAFAIRHHTNRYGSRNYVYHLDAVNFIAHIHQLDFDIQVAAFLHDIIEDTPVSYKNIKMIFGYNISEMVYDVTDELGRNRKEAKMKTYQKTKRNQNAILLKICDRCANIQHSINEHSWQLMRMYLGESRVFEKELIDNTKYRRGADDKNIRELINHYESLMVSANLIFKKHESNTIAIKKSNPT